MSVSKVRDRETLYAITGHFVFQPRQPYTSIEKAYKMLQQYRKGNHIVQNGQVLKFTSSENWSCTFQITSLQVEVYEDTDTDDLALNNIESGILTSKTMFEFCTFENHDDEVLTAEEMYSDHEFINWLIQEAFGKQKSLVEAYNIYKES